MTKSPTIYLIHILEAINAIEEYLKGITENQFYTLEEKQDAVIRRVEVIGEATKRIPEEFKQQHPGVPWKEMSAIRNILIHEYEDVDTAILWDTATQDIPSLKEKIQQLIDTLEKQ